MITATCNTETCKENAVPYNVGGHPDRVQCGACGQWCELTDERDDPPQEIENEPY